MSACLAQQEPLKIGYLGPEGTFSQQAVLQAFRPLGARPAAGEHRGSVPGSRSRQRRFRRRAGRELGAGHDPDHARHVPDLAAEDLRRSRTARAPVPAVALGPHRGHRARLLASAVVRADARPGCAATCRRRRRFRCRATPKRRAARAMPTTPRRSPANPPAMSTGSRKSSSARSRTAPTTRRASSCSAGRSFRLRATTARRCWCSSDQPGALFNVLSPFARHGISMNRIESRPSHQAKWEYAFFIDLAGHVDDDADEERAGRARRHTRRRSRCSGSYPVAVL